MNNKLLTQLCAGILITAELKMHLNQSVEWKVARIDSKQSSNSLIEIPYQGKTYLGCHIPEKISLKDLEIKTNEMKETFQRYCPKFEGPLQICVFAQVLIA